MAGIDTIVNEILGDAKSRADEILDQARKTADEEIAKADEENRARAEAAEQKSQRAVADYEERVRSQCEQAGKLAHLAAKQEVIDDVLAKALSRMKEQDASGYFDMLQKILAGAVREGDGEIALSAQDLARVPSDFAEKAGAIAKKAGGTLRLADAPADIDSGFVLRYGAIEENCQLSALIAEKRDALQDLIAKTLW